MQIPDRHRWRQCCNLGRERACLRVKISPAMQRERDIRSCDVCPVGTDRARMQAANHRRQNALAIA